MKRLVRSGRLWVGVAALSWGLGYSNCAWGGHGSSGGSSGGSHGSSGGSSGVNYSHGSSGGSSGGYNSHGSSGGSSGGYRSNGSQPNGSEPATTPQPLSTSTAKRTTVLLTIFVPADAKLYIEGQPTQLTGTRRDFISPRLESEKDYVYTLKAEVENKGQKMSGTEQLEVRAGDHKTVEFGPSALNPDILVAGRR